MRMKTPVSKAPAEQVVKDIRRVTREHHSAEDKIRNVLEGLRGEDSIAEICRRAWIAESLYDSWSKEFWKLGNVGWLAILPEQRHPTRSRIFVVKPAP